MATKKTKLSDTDRSLAVSLLNHMVQHHPEVLRDVIKAQVEKVVDEVIAKKTMEKVEFVDKATGKILFVAEIPATVMDRLRAIAKVEGVDVNEIMERALREKLDGVPPRPTGGKPRA